MLIGDRVAVRGGGGGRGRREKEGEEVRGVVKYVGDLNGPHTNDPLFVGVKLDDPGITHNQNPAS